MFQWEAEPPASAGRGLLRPSLLRSRALSRYGLAGSGLFSRLVLGLLSWRGDALALLVIICLTFAVSARDSKPKQSCSHAQPGCGQQGHTEAWPAGCPGCGASSKPHGPAVSSHTSGRFSLVLAPAGRRGSGGKHGTLLLPRVGVKARPEPPPRSPQWRPAGLVSKRCSSPARPPAPCGARPAQPRRVDPHPLSKLSCLSRQPHRLLSVRLKTQGASTAPLPPPSQGLSSRLQNPQIQPLLPSRSLALVLAPPPPDWTLPASPRGHVKIINHQSSVAPYCF